MRIYLYIITVIRMKMNLVSVLKAVNPFHNPGPGGCTIQSYQSVILLFIVHKV